jgi:signal transduction histidine kinase
MRTLRLALLLAGIALGVAAEWGSFDAADFAVGLVLLGCGAVAWDRRPESRVGALMSLAGFTWFLGTAFSTALYWHRGPLANLYLSYPSGRLATRLSLAVVAAAYVDAAIPALARDDALTVVLSAAIALATIHGFLRTSGPARSAATPALVSALTFAGVLVLGVAGRQEAWSTDVLLWTYDAVIASLAIVLCLDLVRRRWTEAVVTGLVVDLGALDETRTLRGKLARALGDPSLVVGYRLPQAGAFVDEEGRPVELPSPGSGRVVTPIDDGGERIAVLVHDEAILADRELVDSVAAAARIAVANVRLHAEAQARAAELEASRRRIVEAADAQRRRLGQELRLGAEQRLGTVAALFGTARTSAGADADSIGSLEGELEAARSELHDFAQGIHPSALTERGLMPALESLAARSPLPVHVTGSVERLPEPVEAALYFVCSEALANTIKHAGAAEVRIDVGAKDGRVIVAVNDDGVGGADPLRGSGLRGLADRMAAMGGGLSVVSPEGGGTRVVAELPRTASEPARAASRQRSR